MGPGTSHPAQPPGTATQESPELTDTRGALTHLWGHIHRALLVRAPGGGPQGQEAQGSTPCSTASGQCRWGVGASWALPKPRAVVDTSPSHEPCLSPGLGSEGRWAPTPRWGVGGAGPRPRAYGAKEVSKKEVIIKNKRKRKKRVRPKASWEEPSHVHTHRAARFPPGRWPAVAHSWGGTVGVELPAAPAPPGQGCSPPPHTQEGPLAPCSGRDVRGTRVMVGPGPVPDLLSPTMLGHCCYENQV